MIIIQDTLVSDDVVSEQFVCNLTACKGACCWEGDLGAPLDAEELPILEQIFEKVKPFLSPAGLAAIESQGRWTELRTGDFATPLINGGPCAYMVFDSLGIARCGIETAFREGEIDWKKPISCHLYPIRISKNLITGSDFLNYDRWEICSAACELGEKEQVAVYQFLKEPLIRKYGEDFFEELDGAAQFLKEQN